jgi:hypothetical protein
MMQTYKQRQRTKRAAEEAETSVPTGNVSDVRLTDQTDDLVAAIDLLLSEA